MRASFQRWLRACPLMALAAAGTVGIILAEHDVAGLQRLAFPAAVITLVLAMIVPRRWLLFTGCTLAFAALHAANLGHSFQHPVRLHLLEAGRGIPAVVEGSLTPDYESARPGTSRAICEAVHVMLEDGKEWQMRTMLRVSLPDEQAFPGAGIYRLNGTLRLPGGKDAPGTFDPSDYALRTGIAAEMRVEELERLPGKGAALTCALLAASERCRRWMSEQLSLDLEDDPRTAGVIRAMALGVADEAQDDIEDAFRDSGTLHVFAVSGLHVAMLGLIAWQVLKLLGLRRGAAIWAMVLVVVTYAFITGWRASAARAALMVAVLFGSPAADRDSNVQNNLGLASLLLLGQDTNQLFMPGFQLSFGVLWAIAALSGVFMSPLARWMNLDPFLPVEFADWRHLAAWRSRRWLCGNLCVSAAAWLGSLPFILMHFQSVTPVALIANCVLVPLSIAALVVTCMSILAALVHLTGVQIAINNANWFVAKLMIASAAWFSSLPGACFHLQPSTTQPAEVITWRVLPVPDGGAAHHLHVDDEDWLLDTGPADQFRPLLYPYLRHQGLNHLRGIVLSHNDAAHIGAVPEVSRLFGTPDLYCSLREPGPYDSAETVIRRLQAGPPLKKWNAGDLTRLGREAAFLCLHPSRQSRSMRGDDRAMVLMARLRGWRLLWMSDAGWLTEAALVEEDADLRCDVLLLSSHATDRHGTPEFLRKATPRLVIRGSKPFSRNDGTKPEEDEVAAWCSSHNVPLLSTEFAGGILLELKGEQLHATPAKGAELTLERR